MTNLLTQEQLASTLDVTVLTIIEWQKRGLPHLRGPDGSRTVRYILSEVMEWMKQNASNSIVTEGAQNEG